MTTNIMLITWIVSQWLTLFVIWRIRKKQQEQYRELRKYIVGICGAIIGKYNISFTKDLNTFDISEIKSETTNDI